MIPNRNIKPTLINYVTITLLIPLILWIIVLKLSRITFLLIIFLLFLLFYNLRIILRY